MEWREGSMPWHCGVSLATVCHTRPSVGALAISLWLVGSGGGVHRPRHFMETLPMAGDTWTEADTAQARHYWEAYQQQHDLSARKGSPSPCIFSGLAATSTSGRAPSGADRDGDG